MEWCLICSNKVLFELLGVHVAGPFDRVGVDVMKFPMSSAGNQSAVVFMDYLTKWPEVFATSDHSDSQLLVC